MQFDHGNFNHLYTFSSISSRYGSALEWRKEPPTDRDDLPTPLCLHLGCREKIGGVRPRATVIVYGPVQRITLRRLDL
jgi:hypothetical protein